MEHPAPSVNPLFPTLEFRDCNMLAMISAVWAARGHPPEHADRFLRNRTAICCSARCYPLFFAVLARCFALHLRDRKAAFVRLRPTYPLYFSGINSGISGERRSGARLEPQCVLAISASPGNPYCLEIHQSYVSTDSH